PTTGIGSCNRRCSSAFTSLSFACTLFRIVCLTTVNRPLRFFPQMCVKPRKSNVSGFPGPARCRFSAAKGPNSSSRVFSGCSSRPNFVNRSRRSARNRSASARCWKPHDEVVRVPHDDHVAAGLRLPPPLSPEVERVVQVHVSQERRNAAPLGRAFFTPCPRPVLQHAGVEPLLDQPHDAPVRNAVLDELHQPPVVDGLEKPPDVGIEHPVHLPRQE